MGHPASYDRKKQTLRFAKDDKGRGAWDDKGGGCGLGAALGGVWGWRVAGLEACR
jgi:hypothetical protein